ncbi:vWA domain-containing protein [Sorangium cellulosum]|uniref:vWA domain-containing protein n=1 Tax=Sorangium cellulosum TaxID=56 RepID=UPI0009D72B9D|nr:vWA domain-containing protein [Sorangium cellulosum]
MRRASLVCSVVVLAALSGCTASSDSDRSSDGSSGDPGTGAGPGVDDFGGAAGGEPGGDFTPGATTGGEQADCGRQNFDVERKPASILLVLDRSASMQDDPSGDEGTPSKWDIVVPALQEVIAATNEAASWGLKVFPQGDRTGTCTEESFPGELLIPIASNNAPTVNQAISSTTPEGDGTPTGDAINKAVEYLQAIHNDDPKYILLATDGDPSCPKSDSDEFAVQAVTDAAAAGFHTFVVGIASQESKVKALDGLAVAGLEPRQDPDPLAPRFYLAATKDELVTSLLTITGEVSTCLFPLSAPPPNPDHVGVFVGDQAVLQDTTGTDGWDYTGPDMMTIELHGPACEQVASTGAGSVKVIFGCKDDPIY